MVSRDVGLLGVSGENGTETFIGYKTPCARRNGAPSEAPSTLEQPSLVFDDMSARQVIGRG